jgi:hypothetical protein
MEPEIRMITSGKELPNVTKQHGNQTKSSTNKKSTRRFLTQQGAHGTSVADGNCPAISHQVVYEIKLQKDIPWAEQQVGV